MGLTIHYTLSVREDISVGVVRELVKRTAHYARKIGCARVSEPLRAEEEANHEPMFFDIGPPKYDGAWREQEYGTAVPMRGWLVQVWPGVGCESAAFGLCRYPGRLVCGGRRVAAGFDGGWRLHSFCKTQYAGRHGWAHFLKCHLQVVSLLDFWRRLGVRVEAKDEGGYWETRSIETLRALAGCDQLVAAWSGVLKDAWGESGPIGADVSSIFDYDNFERLEHEGRREFGARIARFQKGLSRVASPPVRSR